MLKEQGFGVKVLIVRVVKCRIMGVEPTFNVAAYNIICSHLTILTII